VDGGRWLAGKNPRRTRIASAAIDTSDGLSTDLDHICRASGVGARIWAESIPTVAIPDALRRHGFNPIELALHGGEDYQLLFTAAGQVPRIYRGVMITRIGEIVALKGRRRSAMQRAGSARESFVEIVDAAGAAKPLIPAGWDHFRKTVKR